MEGFGTVKEVLSGDTVVVMGASKSGPPPELKLTLASLQAPRIGFRNKDPRLRELSHSHTTKRRIDMLCRHL